MKQGFSPTTSAAMATTLVVLGILGWSAGWLVANAEAGKRDHASPSVSVTASSPSPSNRPSPTPSADLSATPAPTPTRTDAFTMPDLVGKDFREARLEAAAARLGVTIVFGEDDGDDGDVVRTNPESGMYVYPGLTIFLYVAGEAPKLKVPDVTGDTCGDGKDALLRAGLLIEEYPSGEKGSVSRTEPAAGAQVAWNTQVKVFCEQSAPPATYSG